jgi:hypothetical protein
MRETYLRAKDLFMEVLADADPTTPVPACPAWTVHELLAHQVHQLRGALDGSFPIADALAALVPADASVRRAAEDRQAAWIDDGVAALRSLSVRELMDEWSALADGAPDAVLDGLVPDIVVHLYDLLGATGSTAHRDDPIVIEALRFWAGQAGTQLPEGDAILAFELLRIITGRRSRDQALSVPVDVALYGWRATPLHE